MLGFEIGRARVLSAWDDPEPINVYLPLVTPGRYLIPGVNASEDALNLCQMRVQHIVNRETSEIFKYARKILFNERPLIVVTVFDARTPLHGTGKQVRDEFNQPMYPDVPRAMLPVPAVQVANEIERQYGMTNENGGVGILAIPGEDPTEEEAKRVLDANLQYKRRMVEETDRDFYRWGPRAVNPQRRRCAWDLKKLGLLNPFPLWAAMNPDVRANELDNCRVCGLVLPTEPVVCPGCKAVYNWDLALEFALVTPDQFKAHEQAVVKRLAAEQAPKPTEDEAQPAATVEEIAAIR